MTLTKSKIIEILSQRTGFTKTDSAKTVEALVETIKGALAGGEDVLVSGFGKFTIQDKQERAGRNPATGESLTLAARKVVKFKCSDKLKQRVNGE